MKVLVVKYRTE